MTDFQVILVMFCAGWCSSGIFMTLSKLIKIDKKLDEILKAVKE